MYPYKNKVSPTVIVSDIGDIPEVKTDDILFVLPYAKRIKTLREDAIVTEILKQMEEFHNGLGNLFINAINVTSLKISVLGK